MHDNERRTPLNWAGYQKDKNIRIKFITYIQEARHKASSSIKKFVIFFFKYNFNFM